MNHLLLLTLAAALLLAAVPAHAETTSSFEIRFTDLTHAELKIIQKWEGTEAAEFRQSLDRSLGNGDGNLNATEVDRILTATKSDFEDAWHPRLRMDGEHGHITSANIDEDGLPGTTASEEAITLTHDVRIEWNATDNATHRFNTTIGVGPYAATGNVTIHAPPGWIVEQVDGFVEDPETGGGSVSGKAEFGENIRATFKEGQQDVRNGRTPGLGFVAVLGVAVAVGLVARRRLR